METLFGKLIVSVLGVSLLGGVAVRDLKPNTPIIKKSETIVIQENKRTPTEKWLDFVLPKLAQCESGNNPNAVNWNDNGSPSFGLFQYKKSTWITGLKQYKLFPYAEDEEFMNFIYDRATQTELTKMILIDGGWRHWTNCFTRLKLPKNENG